MPKKKRLRFSERMHKCTDCGKKFKYNSQLAYHARMHTGEKPYDCNVCGKKFRQQGTLSNHSKVHTGEKLYVCPWPECAKSFSTKANLQTHEARHSGEKSFVCGECDRAFFSSSELKQHEIRHENHQIFKCCRCLKTFGSQAGLKRHENSDEGLACIPNLPGKGDKPYVCKTCGKRFAQRSGLYVHGRIHQADKHKFECTECAKTFSTKTTLQQHILRHKGQRNYNCSKCPKAFFTSGELRQHTLRHELREKFKCFRCDRGYVNEDALATHQAHPDGCDAAAAVEKTTNKLQWLSTPGTRLGTAGTQPRVWPCGYCNRKFKYKSYMESHQRIHTGERPFKCGKCEKRFRYHSSLWNHNRICGQLQKKAAAATNKSRPDRSQRGHFTCDQCRRPFIRLAAMNAHKAKVHNVAVPGVSTNADALSALLSTPIKSEMSSSSMDESMVNEDGISLAISATPSVSSFTCFCGKSFSYESQLKAHLRVHTGERPYQCKYCAKSFTQKPTLQNHERTHTGEKPFKCRYCELTFGQYSARATHENSKHLDNKCYKCDQCAKTLSSPSALYAHRKLHQTKAYECDLCGKMFALNNYLKQHIRNVHSDDKSSTPKVVKENRCEFCDKVFPHPSSLYVHRRIHTGEKPYKCSYCDRAFVSQGNMQAHERTHTGAKPYKCPAELLCGNTGYTQRVALKSHLAKCAHYQRMQHEQTILNAAATMLSISGTDPINMLAANMTPNGSTDAFNSSPSTSNRSDNDNQSCSSPNPTMVNAAGSLMMNTGATRLDLSSTDSDNLLGPPTMISPNSWLASAASAVAVAAASLEFNPQLMSEIEKQLSKNAMEQEQLGDGNNDENSGTNTGSNGVSV